LGYQAEKILTELERARLAVISDTVQMAEMLHDHFGHCASDLKVQEAELKIPHVELLEEEKHVPEALLVGDNIVAQTSLELQRNLEANGHIAREKIDAALESKFGSKAERVLLEVEKVKGMALEDTVQTVDIIHEQLGVCASSLREQLVHGITPNYH